MILQCNKCLLEKNESDFKKCSRNSRGYVYSCKECERKRNSILKRQKAEEVYFYLLERGCKHCGELNPLKLEFDHIDPSIKKYNISEMLCREYALNTIFIEIAKCQVLCSNCHSVKTHKERNTITYQIHQECK